MYRNKTMFILTNLGTKCAGLNAYLSYYQINELNGMLKYKVKMFFTTILLNHDKKYCLQVYYEKAILPPHYFCFLISLFSVYNIVD